MRPHEPVTGNSDLKSRIGMGLIYGVMIMLPLLLLGRFRYDMHFGGLGEAYDNLGYTPFEPPILVKCLLPVAPVRWWSYLSPITIGIAVGARLERKITAAKLTFSLVGAVILFATVFEIHRPYVELQSFMGYPASDPIDSLNLLGNIGLVGSSVGFALISVVSLLKQSKIAR